ncbi:MAG: GNAT family N-acetyltransferase [Firmicutes bacterium]|jgi:RimJ/RimL family protein N-acetyltransferase|nr:GNAT family N-acetyltransferase [Bacillota bacterium]
MKIKGERLVLRPIVPSDFAKIVQWTKDPEVGHYMDDDGCPEALEDCQEWYDSLRSNRRNRRLIIATLDGQPIGDIELDHITWRSGDAELRIRIGEADYRGKGFGVESISTLLIYAFGKMNLSRVYLRVAKGNTAAIRCYEKVGFKKEGKLVRSQTQKQSQREIYLMRILKDEFYRFHHCSYRSVG